MMPPRFPGQADEAFREIREIVRVDECEEIQSDHLIRVVAKESPSGLGYVLHEAVGTDEQYELKRAFDHRAETLFTLAQESFGVLLDGDVTNDDECSRLAPWKHERRAGYRDVDFRSVRTEQALIKTVRRDATGQMFRSGLNDLLVSGRNKIQDSSPHEIRWRRYPEQLGRGWVRVIPPA